MIHRTDTTDRSVDATSSFVRLMEEWIEEHDELLCGLVALRDLGFEAEDATSAVLAIREVRKFTLSWQMCELLAEDDGIDFDAALAETFPVAIVNHLRYALFGDEDHDYRPYIVTP